MSVEAERGYRMWKLLIADEELFEATVEQRHRELAESRDLAAEDIAVLDQFAAEPGTRWNVENLRFRCALHVGSMAALYLPTTVAILTENREMWLQDIAFEYLAHHRWYALGTELREVERFGDYVRERVVKRRIVPPYLESVLAHELAIVRLRKMTTAVPAELEPLEVTDDELATLVFARGPAVVTSELPFELSVLKTLRDKPEAYSHAGIDDEIPRRPVKLLGFVRTRAETPRFIKLVDAVEVVLEACDGQRTAAEVAERLGEELELEPAEVFGVLRRLRDRGILAVALPA